MLYDLINPSDPYTLRTEFFEIAAQVCILLSEGQYGLKPLEPGGEDVPIFLFTDPDPWFIEHFGRSLNDSLSHVLANQGPALAAAFRSVVLGSPHDREEFEASLKGLEPQHHERFRKEWDQKRRSSLNNIGACAQQYALRVEELMHDRTAKAERDEGDI